MVWQSTRPVWTPGSSVWEKNSGTLKMACGGPERRGRKGREPNGSHEWEGRQRNTTELWEQFEAILLNCDRRSLVRDGCLKDARHLANHHSWTAQTLQS